MASTTATLTREDYDRRFGPEPGWEFRSGEAIRKPVPTYLHSLLQLLLGELLRRAGYIALTEVDVHLSDEWSPRPDVCGLLKPIDQKYPSCVDVVCEIQSENQDLVQKCQDYDATGKVGQMVVFNVETRAIWTWNGTDLAAVEDVVLQNGVRITGTTIWRELQERRELQHPVGDLI